MSSFLQPSVERRSMRRFFDRRPTGEATPLWLTIVNSLFYVVVALALIGFGSYLYSFQSSQGLLTLYVPFLLKGAEVTIIVSLVSMVFAVLFGFIGAMGRLSRVAPIRWLATTYVEVVRGTPFLVQLLLWYYGVGYVLSTLGFNPYNIVYQVMTVLQNNSLVPNEFNSYFYGVIGLSFNYGAYLTEVFRSGIQSVDAGQTEAALSLGLNSRQTMSQIILPQAIRNILPPLTNYFITLVQDSALLAVLSVIELDHQTYAIALTQTDSNVKFFVFVLGALFYFVICYALALLAHFLERRFSKGYHV